MQLPRLSGTRQSKLMLSVVLAFALVLSIVPWTAYLPGAGLTGPATVEAAGPAPSRFFPQTGFFLRNRDNVSFLAEFERLGGIERMGYPVSRVFQASGFSYQAFQRGVLQWRPESNAATVANTMDQLHDSGKDDWLLTRGIPRHYTKEDGSGGDFNKAKEIRASWLTEPRIKQTYLGVPDPLGFYGLPTSLPERYGPFVAQRFQRGVLQLWLDDVPGMPRPGEVVGVLAGDLAIEAKLLGPEQLKPEYDGVDVELGEFTLPVPAFHQERNLSCESSAAAMAASYFGVPLPERQIVAEIPRDPNPHKGFRGSIDSWFGGLDDYGVYAEPIAQVLSKHGLNAEVVYDLSPEALREAIRHDKVVVAWITYEVVNRTPVAREIGGERVTLVPWEHAVTVKGYDARGVMVNDPGTGGAAYYTNADFARANGYFDGMAVIVSR